MSTYHDHADRAGLKRRLAVLASAADRATMLRILEERDIGCVTLTMTRRELCERLRQASLMHRPVIDWETGYVCR